MDRSTVGLLVLNFALIALLDFVACNTPEGNMDLRHYGIPAVDFNVNYDTENLRAALSHIPQGRVFVKELLSAKLPLKASGTSESIQDVCLSDSRKIWTDFTGNVTKYYAERYVDAAFKIPSGFFQGKWMWTGDYQECYDIDPVYNPATKHSFKGKHFMVGIYFNGKPVIPKLNLPAFLGICLPDSCDNNTVYGLGVYAIDQLGLSSTINVIGVTTQQKVPNDSGTIVAYVILGIFGFLVLFGTAVDLWEKNRGDSDKLEVLVRENLGTYNAEPTERSGLLAGDSWNETIQERRRSIKQTLIKLAQAFSFMANTERLLGTKTAVGPLACLNGLRVISMWWVIQGHTYVFSELSVNNIAHALKITQRFDFQAILNGTFSVDSFFFLSGLLVAYLALKEFREKGKINWIYFFCHRFWRLTPLYAIVLMIFTKLFIHFIHGPYQFLVTVPTSPYTAEYKSCEKYWWTNLIYINNFYPKYGNLVGTCMPWAWYLANDMQFYIFISPVFVFLIYKYRRFGLAFAFFLIAACIAIRGIFVVYYGLETLGGNATKNKDNWGKVGATYQRPYTRMAVYVVGLLTGHVLVATDCKVRLNKVLAILGWMAASAIALAVVYGQYYYSSHPAVKMTQVAAGFYISLSRFAWSISLSWLVLACASGYGGPINSILSFKIWAPLGRLTFAAYLVHPIIIYAYYLNLEEPLHFTDYTMVYMYLGNLVLSYGAAFLLSMAVEAPMMQIEKVFIQRHS